MKFQIDHDLHMHSEISLCSGDPEQTPERIVQYAQQNGLHTVCMTNHFWDEKVPGNDVGDGKPYGSNHFYQTQNFAYICQEKPLPQREDVRFLFGCETEMNRLLTIGLSEERFDEFDFIIVPTTHLHMVHFTATPEQLATPRARAQLWVQRYDALLDAKLPFHKTGVAHLDCSLIAPSKEELVQTMALIPKEELRRLFTKTAQVGMGVELNSALRTKEDEEIFLNLFGPAKECGCKFYLGSDAHHPKELDEAMGRFERMVSLLGLEETDKFRPEA